MRELLKCRVHAKPIAQNDRVAGLRRDGRPYVYYRNGTELYQWRGEISSACHAGMAMSDATHPLDGVFGLWVTFYLPRPKSHYLSSGTLRPNAPEYHAVTPDASNLLKAVEDGITDSGFWKDDSRLAEIHCRKMYAEYLDDVGCEFSVFTELEERS